MIRWREHLLPAVEMSHLSSNDNLKEVGLFAGSLFSGVQSTVLDMSNLRQLSLSLLDEVLIHSLPFSIH